MKLNHTKNRCEASVTAAGRTMGKDKQDEAGEVGVGLTGYLKGLRLLK